MLKSTLLGSDPRPMRVEPEALRDSATSGGRADALVALVATALAEYDPTPLRVKVLDAIGDGIVPWDQMSSSSASGQWTPMRRKPAKG